MDRDLIYRISVRGAAESARALDGFGARLRALQEQEQAFDRATDSMNRRRGERDRATTRDSVREAETAARAKVKAAEQSARASAREEERAARDAAKARTSAVRDAAREQIDIAKQAAKERERIEKDLNRVMLDAQKTAAREQAALHRQAVRDEERRMRDRAFDTKRLIRGTVDGVFEGAGSAFRAPVAIAGMAGRGLRTVAGGLGVNDAFDVQSVISEQARVQKLLDSVAIEARTPGSSLKGGVVRDAQGRVVFDRNAAGADLTAASNRYGLGQGVLAAGIDEASRLGSGADVANNMEDFASATKAYGGDEEAAKTVAKLRTQIRTSASQFGKDVSDSDIGDFVAKLAIAGKKGNMRGADIGKYAERIMSSAMARGVDITTEGDRFIQLMQLTNAVTGSPAQTATALSSIGNQIAKKEGLINSLGIKTKDRSEIDIMAEVIAATHGTQQGDATFNKIFDPSKSGKVTLALRDAYARGERAKKGGGMAAIDEELSKNSISGADARKELASDNALQAETASDKLQTAMVKVRNALAQQLEPVMAQFATDAPVHAKAIGEVIAALGPVMRDSLLPALVELGKEAPKMAKSIADAAQQIGPIVKWFFGLAVENPKAAAVLGLGASMSMGGIGGGGGAVLASVAKWTSEGLVNTVPHLVPGAAGKVLAGAAGVAGSIAGAAGSTPVYVTGVAPGVGLGGGGLGDIAGAVGGSGVAAEVGTAAAAAATGSLVAVLGVVAAGLAGLGAGYLVADATMGKGTAGDKALKRLAGHDPTFEMTDEERNKYYHDNPTEGSQTAKRGWAAGIRKSLNPYGPPAADAPINTGDGVIHAASAAPASDGVIRSTAAQKAHDEALKRSTEAHKAAAAAAQTLTTRLAGVSANTSALTQAPSGPG